MQKRKNKGITVGYLVLVTALTVGVICALWAVLRVFFFIGGNSNPLAMDDGSTGNYLAVLQISYSTIFLSTSLLGMLSDKGATVYWVNVNDYVLVNPRFFNFFSLSVIGFVSLLIETMAVLWKDGLLFDICFCIGIVSIIIIFFKMIGSGYNHDNLKKRLERKYTTEIEKLLEDKQEEKITNYKDEIYFSLWKNTEIASADGKCKVVDENMYFLIHYLLKTEDQEKIIRKLGDVFLVLNRYGVLDREIAVIWKMTEDNDIKTWASIAVLSEDELINVWDRLKSVYFYDTIDEYIDRQRELAEKEYESTNLEEDGYSWDGAFRSYRNCICRVCKHLSEKRENADDLVAFLSRRMVNWHSFERKMCIYTNQDMVCNSDGTQEFDSEQGDVLSIVLLERLRDQVGVDRCLDAIERMLLKESYIKENNKGRFCFVIPPEQRIALFNTISALAGSELKKIQRDEELLNRYIEILEGIVLQREQTADKTKFVSDGKRMKKTLELLRKYGKEEYWSDFLKRLHAFLAEWEEDEKNFIDQWHYEELEEETAEEQEAYKQKKRKILNQMLQLIDVIIGETKGKKERAIQNEFMKLRETVDGTLQTIS